MRGSGGVFINGHSTGEKQAELSLCVQLEDATGTPVGEPKYAGDVTISCNELDVRHTPVGVEASQDYKFWVRVIDGRGHTISEGHHHAPMGL